jgi:cytochrome c oxidase subunit 3
MNTAAAAAPAHANRPHVSEPADEAHRAEIAKLGMWVFLGTEVLFFGALLFAYAMGRVFWPQGFGLASRHTDVVLGTLNTGVLLTSSAAVALVVLLDEHGARPRWATGLVWFTAAMGVAFVVIKGIEYHKEWVEGLFPGPGFELSAVPGAELFFMLYFFMTALHALHLLIGIGVMSVFGVGRLRRSAWVNPRRMEIAALYWHFVDIVWIFLYPLLYLVNRHS